eukprot:scaffold4466_cov53-Phaeocystis_antarctica.AAC.3
MLGCVLALLLAGASTQLVDVNGGAAPQWPEVQGQPTTAELTWQHAAPPQPTAPSPAAPLDTGEPAVSSPAPLPIEIYHSAGRGELQKVVKWLGKGGPVDALYSARTEDGRTATFGLLHIAATNGQLEMARVLLQRGASVDLPGNLGLTALMSAAYHGHLSIALLLLQHSANPDLQETSGTTALMAAAVQGQVACVQALLRAKANTELFDYRGFTALRHAEDQGHSTTAKLIRQHAAPPPPAAAPAAPLDAGEPGVSSPASLPVEIYESAERGELQKVASWLRKGGPVDALCPVRAEDGRTAACSLLHAAASNGQLEIVRELLQRGASVDLPGSLGLTALMEAAGIGLLPTLRLLLQHSANPDLQDRNGYTALILAAKYGEEACVQALLRAKANTEVLDYRGFTALRHAEDQGHTTTAKLIRQHAAPPQPAAAPAAAPDAAEPAEISPAILPLEIYHSAGRGELRKVASWLRKGGPVDALCPAPSDDGRNATYGLLHAAARNNQLEMVRELLKRGASVDLPSSIGGTALMAAASYGHLSVVLLLLQHSANPNLQANGGGTALMKAAGKGQKTCVQALLRAKANTELLDDRGFTALRHAEAKGHTTTAQLLRQHASCPSLGLGVALCAVLMPLAWPSVVLS